VVGGKKGTPRYKNKAAPTLNRRASFLAISVVGPITRCVIPWMTMIRSFRDPKTETLFNDQDVPRYRAIERAARRKLLFLHQARRLDELKVSPGNRLEVLKGNRKGQYSICINDQWRICFHWKDGDAFDVEIVDYH